MSKHISKVDEEAVRAILGANPCFYQLENKADYLTCRFRIPPEDMSYFTLLDYVGGTKLIFNFYSVATEVFTFLLFEKDVEFFIKANLEKYVR